MSNGYLADMENAIAKIHRYTAEMTLDDFMDNEMVWNTIQQVIPEFLSKIRSIQAGQ